MFCSNRNCQKNRKNRAFFYYYAIFYVIKYLVYQEVIAKKVDISAARMPQYLLAIT